MGVPVRSPPFKLAVGIILIFIALYYVSHGSGKERTSKHLDIIYNHADDFYDRVVYGKKASFIDDALETEIDGFFNYTAIRKVCDNKKWTEGVIFECVPPKGDVGRVRNVILNCVRYAIEAGASFIIPKINARGIVPDHPEREEETDFSYFFDTSHFVSSMTIACPQMKIYQSLDSLWDKPSVAIPLDLSPQSLSETFVHGTVIENPKDWSKNFRNWLNGSASLPVSATVPSRVTLHDTLFQFPITYDSGEFSANFGRILRFREDVRRLAATVLYALNEKYRLGLDADVGIMPKKFYGAHLPHVNSEEETAGWTPTAIQSQAYISDAYEKKLSLVYLSALSSVDADEFNNLASSPLYNLTTVTSFSLLSGDKEFTAETEQLKTLTWHQSQLVDFEVLLKSSAFGGTKESAFAWSVAMRRHIVVAGGTARLLGADQGASQTFKDSLSTIFGNSGDMKEMAASLWP